MPIRKYGDVQEVPVEMEGVSGLSKMVPIGKNEGWQDYTLRVFKIASGGNTPRHKHDWEHVNYIISGRGRLTIDDEVHELEAKDFSFVPPGSLHQFENPYSDEFEFICIVPNRGEF